MPRERAQAFPAGQQVPRQQILFRGQHAERQLLTAGRGQHWKGERPVAASVCHVAVSDVYSTRGTQTLPRGQHFSRQRFLPAGHGGAGMHCGIDPPPDVRTILPPGSLIAGLQAAWSFASQHTPFRPANRSSISAVQGNAVFPLHVLMHAYPLRSEPHRCCHEGFGQQYLSKLASAPFWHSRRSLPHAPVADVVARAGFGRSPGTAAAATETPRTRKARRRGIGSASVRARSSRNRVPFTSG